PSGTSRPTASVLNMAGDGTTTQNLVTTALGSARASIFSSAATDLVVDVFGYYTPALAAAAGRLVATAPTRLFDSRPSHSTVRAGGTVRVPRPAVVAPDAMAM